MTAVRPKATCDVCGRSLDFVHFVLVAAAPHDGDPIAEARVCDSKCLRKATPTLRKAASLAWLESQKSPAARFWHEVWGELE